MAAKIPWHKQAANNLLEELGKEWGFHGKTRNSTAIAHRSGEITQGNMVRFFHEEGEKGREYYARISKFSGRVHKGKPVYESHLVITPDGTFDELTPGMSFKHSKEMLNFALLVDKVRKHLDEVKKV